MTQRHGAAVYVGTYGKYNNGSIKGGWLSLADYPTFADFLKACSKLHADERDPEFMIQDCECMPDGLTCGEWMTEAEYNDIQLAMREEMQEAEGRPSINIIDYSDKAFAVVGDTKAVKDELKRMGGRFNGKLSCGAGWIFCNAKRADVEKFIASGEVCEAVRQERKAQTIGGEKFIEWLNEYKRLAKTDDYKATHSVGAIMIRGRYYLIDKPSIETRFCFHDEGPQYDMYKDLTSNDDKMAAYFKAENLGTFDRQIRHIERGDEDWSTDTRVWGLPNDYNKNYLEIQFYDDRSAWAQDRRYLCTDDEKALILEGLKFGRACFERRLDAYLKRYGTTKLHTWTYWADA